jgi:pilus assembly protein CpaB
VSRRRRAALLLGLALALGTLAASDVARREAALRDQAGPAVAVLVAARPLAAGRRLAPGDLALRRVPERFAPGGGAVVPELVVGRRLAVPVPAGAAVGEHLLARAPTAPSSAIHRGERAVEVVATGSAAIAAGARVDVLVTRERGSGGGDTELALEDVEVLAARPAPDRDGGGGGPQRAATLRVTVRQAVYLAAAGAFARDIRLLARAPGDHQLGGRATVGADLTLIPRGG